MLRRQSINTNPWLGGCLGGLIRILGMSFIVLVLGSIGSALFESFDTNTVVKGWLGHYWYLKIIPEKGLRIIAFLVRSYRYYLLVFLGFLGIFYFGGRYIRDIYNLDKLSWAFRYLSSLLFGFPYPKITIRDGEKQLSQSEFNLLDKIGGPGYLVIQPGSLALLEGANGTTRVCAEGSNFVTRFEKIRDVFSLDDRQGYIESTSATTKDGITLEVRNVLYGYRLRTGRVSSDTARQDADSPYSFSYRAVLNRVFSRSVGSKGITPWHDMVNLAVDAAITDYIRKNLFDDVTAPRFGETEPRIEIAKILNSEGIRDRLKGVGAELLWVDMGHFEVMDKRIEAQRVETWGAKWLGAADVRRALGDAKQHSYRDIGRTEAQAEMIISIMDAFTDMQKLVDENGHPIEDSDKLRDERIKSIILARTAQILDSMASQDDIPPSRRFGELPPPK